MQKTITIHLKPSERSETFLLNNPKNSTRECPSLVFLISSNFKVLGSTANIVLQLLRFMSVPTKSQYKQEMLSACHKIEIKICTQDRFHRHPVYSI
jgi:hypothetical protein